MGPYYADLTPELFRLQKKYGAGTLEQMLADQHFYLRDDSPPSICGTGPEIQYHKEQFIVHPFLYLGIARNDLTIAKRVGEDHFCAAWTQQLMI